MDLIRPVAYGAPGGRSGREHDSRPRRRIGAQRSVPAHEAPASSAPETTIQIDRWERTAPDLSNASASGIRLRPQHHRMSELEQSAQRGLSLLDHAVQRASQLASVLAELEALVAPGVAVGPWHTDLERLRQDAHALLRTVEQQRGSSLDGSTLGDALRSDIETERSSRTRRNAS